MTNSPETQSSTDPAAVWWNHNHRAANTTPPHDPMVAMLQPEPWRWRYSFWVGIMYGPIPVGLIIGIPLLFLVFAK
ncbi:MAG: hypothetical protein WKG01_02590 [Kofleriaceae bacterium]